MKRDTEADILLMQHLRECGFGFLREVKICPERRWRVDYVAGTSPFAFQNAHFAIEIDGGQFRGGHRSCRTKNGRTDVERDNDKMNALAVMRIPVLHFTPQQIERSEDLAVLREFQEKS